MLEEFANQEYRHAFVDEAIRSRITSQIGAMRKERGWDYSEFAKNINKKVSWTYRLEDPNAAFPTIPTLLEVAAALDIGLDVRFRSFSELLDDVRTLDPSSFAVPSFDAEIKTDAFSKPRRTIRVLNYGSKVRQRRTRGGSRYRAPGDQSMSRLESIGAANPGVGGVGKGVFELPRAS